MPLVPFKEVINHYVFDQLNMTFEKVIFGEVINSPPIHKDIFEFQLSRQNRFVGFTAELQLYFRKSLGHFC